MRFWLIVICLISLLPYVLVFLIKFVFGPIKIHSKHRLCVRPQWRDTAIEPLTPEMRDFAGRMIRQFRAEGFETAANVHLPDGVPGVESFQALMVNRESGDLAIVAMVRAHQTRALSFMVRSEFGDGTRLITAAHRPLGFFPKNPADDVENFPWVTEPAALCEVHRRRLARAGKNERRRVAPDPGHEIEYLNADWARSARWFVRCGYHFVDDAAGVQRLTWKGAIWASWKLQEPIKRWRLNLRNRRARRSWRQLGMNEWRPAAVETPASQPVPRNVVDKENGAALEPYDARASSLQPADLSLPPPAPDQAEPLQYALGLVEGELRIEQIGGSGVSIRAGGATTARVLRRQWLRLLFIGIFSAPIVTWLVLIVYMPAARPRGFQLKDLLISLFMPAIFVTLMAVELLRLLRALWRARGTITIAANRQGLRFTNIPAQPRNGEIARDQIEVLAVVVDGLGFKGIAYRFEVRRSEQRRPLVLMYNKDPKALQSARKALAVALGIEAEDEAVLAPVV
ncbi:MAG TPA: hypothetical protein VFC78_06155 [Tepidisphaeraceae bacterium]|nr:hypothetical protein [Tepidisphaeraceae bacterium]